MEFKEQSARVALHLKPALHKIIRNPSYSLTFSKVITIDIIMYM